MYGVSKDEEDAIMVLISAKGKREDKSSPV